MKRFLLLKLIGMCIGLSILSDAYATTSTANKSTLISGFNDGTHSTSWAAGHITFRLSGTDNAIYTALLGSYFYLSNGVHYGLIPLNEGKTFTLSWQVDGGYDIEITNVTINVDRASGANSYITVGDGPRTGDLFASFSSFNISTGSHTYTTNETIPIVFEKATSWSTVAVNSITVTYTLIPLFIYDGSGDGSAGDTEHLRWDKADNWLHNNVPTINDEVYIRHDVIVEGEVAAKKMTIEDDNHVTIMPDGKLKIGTGGIVNATTENLKLAAATTGANRGKTGSLLISPSYIGSLPNATVEMYSVAYFDMNADDRNNVASWQYVGSPMAAGTPAKTIFSSSWCYNWDEAAGEWKNNRRTLTLAPFVGYATSQYTDPAGLLVSHVGQVASNGNIVLPLTYNGSGAEGGANVLANSYTAPIDITKMQTSDFVNAEATIYLFNTGSKNDEATASTNSDPGQYIAIPIHLAGTGDLPAVIPSMQGFYVQASTPGVNGSLTLNYERLVWNAAHSNTSLRAPQQIHEEDKATLCVSLYADGWSDRLYLIESEENEPAFENGYDAHKMMSGNLNIFAIEGSDSLAVDATNAMIGTRIGVRTGYETAYTLVFSHLNHADELVLVDAEAMQTIDINEGTQYTFFAEPNSVLAHRFSIVERQSPAVLTDLDNTSTGESKVKKFIKNNQLYILHNGALYTIMGTVVQQ